MVFFIKKFQQPSILVYIWNKIANFESKLHLKMLVNFEQNGSFDQKMLLLKFYIFLEFQVYVDLFGRDGAQRMFRRHVKKLKDDYLNSKVQRYFDVLPEVLHQLFPDFETFTEE